MSRLVRSEDLVALDPALLSTCLSYFLADDSSDASRNSAIMSDPGFQPDTFTVLDRFSSPPFLANKERDCLQWLRELVMSDLELLVEQGDMSFDDISRVACLLAEQLLATLLFPVAGRPLAAALANQELPDFSRKVIGYCLTGSLSDQIHPHRAFNEIGAYITPKIIDFVVRDRPSVQDLLAYSIASGLIGIDLKGAAAAASDFGHLGIQLRPLLPDGLHTVPERVYKELQAVVSRRLQVNYWDVFAREVLGRGSTLLWFTDDYIESMFDLLLLQQLIEMNPSLHVILVPKNGNHGNDLSYADAISFLQLPVFAVLRANVSQGRVRILAQGPRMGAVNLSKLSADVVDCIQRSDVVLVKGCRAHEMVQGGLGTLSYTAYVVAREFSEAETGFDSRECPLVFFRSAPGEYAYWGFMGRADRSKRFDDGRVISIGWSTLEEHERRKAASSAQSVLEELALLLSLREMIQPRYLRAFRQEVLLLMEKLPSFESATLEEQATARELAAQCLGGTVEAGRL